MGRVGVSDLQVFKAADQLAAEGIRPTVDTVRSELGDTGSRTTINRYLKEWRERKEKRQQVDADLGNHLLSVLKDQSTQLLASLEDVANRKFEAKKAHYEQLIADHSKQLKDCRDGLTTCQQRLDTARADNTGYQARIQQLQAQLNDAQDDLQGVRGQLAKETGRRETLETALSDQQRQLQSLQKEMKTIRDRNEILTESLASKTAELHTAQRTERELRVTLKQKTEEIRKANQALKSAQKKTQDFGKLTKSMNKLVSTFNKETRT